MPGKYLCGSGEGAGSGGKARCWVVRGDWCGCLSVVIVWACTIFVDYCVTQFAIVPLYFQPKPTTEGWIHLVSYQWIIFIIFVCHCTASFSDPGLIPADTTNGLHEAAFNSLMSQIQDSRPNDARTLKRLYCKKCKIPKPRGAHHSST